MVSAQTGLWAQLVSLSFAPSRSAGFESGGTEPDPGIMDSEQRLCMLLPTGDPVNPVLNGQGAVLS